MIMDEDIVKQIMNDAKYINAYYPDYFQPEIQSFAQEKLFPQCKKEEISKFELGFSNMNEYEYEYKNRIIQLFKKELPTDFFENRRIGENNEHICHLIQKDLIDEFITYVNKNNYSLNMSINTSIYETNSILLQEKKTTLIEYAAFFGSIQIFKYLYKNEVKLTPSLFIYAIHGDDSEIINIVEEKVELSIGNLKEEGEEEDEEEEDDNKDELTNITYLKCFFKAIECHHNDVANYIFNNYLESQEIDYSKFILKFLQYYNYQLILRDYYDSILNESYFYWFCEYDYYFLANLFLTSKDFDVNEKQI